MRDVSGSVEHDAPTGVSYTSETPLKVVGLDSPMFGIRNCITALVPWSQTYNAPGRGVQS